MNRKIGFRDFEVIPNGVNMEYFGKYNSDDEKKFLGWDASKIHILFPSNPERFEKNYDLAKDALKILNNSEDYSLHYLKNIPYNSIPNYFYASDLVLLTSKWEGSPNVIKEAMACNKPIVSTEVGDIRWLLDGLKGCYISRHDANELALKIKLAKDFSNKYKLTTGRNRIYELNLDSSSIARIILNLYEKTIKQYSA
jgi:glycosyltransferase involved in cell wall biosynthesis